MSKEGPDIEVVKTVDTKQARDNSVSKAPRKVDDVIQMTKEGYLKFLGQLLREHYNSIKESGSASAESEQFQNGYLTALREKLVMAISQAKGEYVFTKKNGRIFDVDSFRKNPWVRALQRAGLSYRMPGTTRHSFAAAGVEPIVSR